MPFSPNSSSSPKKLSSEYQLYACGNFFRHSSILEKIAILGQPPRLVKGLQTEANNQTNTNEIKEILRAVAPGGGYCMGSGNSVPEWAKFENFMSMREATLKYGRYSIKL